MWQLFRPESQRLSFPSLSVLFKYGLTIGHICSRWDGLDNRNTGWQQWHVIRVTS